VIHPDPNALVKGVGGYSEQLGTRWLSSQKAYRDKEGIEALAAEDIR